jgi:hypothetical protein
MTALSQFAHKSPKLSGSHQTEPVPTGYIEDHSDRWQESERGKQVAEIAGDLENAGTHLRRDTIIPQWFQASKAAGR